MISAKPTPTRCRVGRCRVGSLTSLESLTSSRRGMSSGPLSSETALLLYLTIAGVFAGCSSTLATAETRVTADEDQNSEIAGAAPAVVLSNDMIQSDAEASPDGAGVVASRAAAGAKSHCQYPCSCQKDPPRCKMGNTIKDGCNCCHICPRQQGDLCDLKFRCDEERGLYCEFNLDDGHRGICRAKSPKSCDVDGKSYKDGEEVRTCSQLCTCQNGVYACASLCPQEDRVPSRTHCRDAQLVTIAGHCCREWVCPHAHSLPHPDDTDPLGTAGVFSASSGDKCVKESTEWSPCSVSCGMGVSTRLTNNNKDCQSRQERQLCLIRPCNLDDKHINPIGNKCRSTWRDRELNLKYGECSSVETYRPKYCTTCKRNRCCGPGRTKTRDISFRCPDGKAITEQFMWIGSCECRPSKNCPYDVIYDGRRLI